MNELQVKCNKSILVKLIYFLQVRNFRIVVFVAILQT